MDIEYEKFSSVDEFINPDGVCIVCHKPGLHSGCEKSFVEERNCRLESIQKREVELKKVESQFLIEYSVLGSYGIRDHLRFNEAKNKIRELYPEEHSYDGEREVENDLWFFVPYFYIGCIGYIVDKDNFEVYPVGSVYSHIWDGVEAFEKGLLKCVNS